jgi:hypothetical protein
MEGAPDVEELSAMSGDEYLPILIAQGGVARAERR